LNGVGGVFVSGDDIIFNPITANAFPAGVATGTNGNCTQVFNNGSGTAPVFNYVAAPGETLVLPGTLSNQSKVVYYDYNDYIYLVVEMRINNFQLTPIGGSKWSAAAPTLQINGLPVNTAPTADISENVTIHMSMEPVAGFPLGTPTDDYMLYMKEIPLVYGAGGLSAKNPGAPADDFFCIPATGYPINLRFNCRMLINKN